MHAYICYLILQIVVSITQNNNNYSVKSQETCNISRQSEEAFSVAFEWAFYNFTWPSVAMYQSYLKNGLYIPQNNVVSGMKVYENTVYLSLPKFRNGAPVTLAAYPKNSSVTTNVLLKPYPNWDMNLGRSCSSLQSVQGMEIDTAGIMWVIDGNRMFNLTHGCPGKLILLDLNDGGKVVHVHVLSDLLCRINGCDLNDIVIDETDGGYAYISESGLTDPGLLIYSRKLDKFWKIRDRTIYHENSAIGFTVNGRQMNNLVDVDGIALSPISKNGSRTIYYSALTSYSLYAISTSIVKNETVCEGAEWRTKVRYLGRKGIGDGMVVDNRGNLYSGLLPQYAIWKWNIYEQFDKNATAVYQNYSTVIWPDTFAFDGDGNLYVLQSNIDLVQNNTYPTVFNNDIKFRVLLYHTGTKSYLYY